MYDWVEKTFAQYLGPINPGANPFSCPDPYFCPHGAIIRGGYRHGVKALLCPETGRSKQQLSNRHGYWLTRRGARLLHFQDPRIQKLKNFLWEHRKERYQAYLQSPWWAKKRNAVLERCNALCEKCKALPVAHIHHLTYLHFGDERLEELQGLCEDCHKSEHHVVSPWDITYDRTP